MEELFAELGIDMTRHLALLHEIDLDRLAAETIQVMKDLAPLAGGESWEI